jgi:hypothetical protein
MNIVQAGKTAVKYLRHASPVISAGVAVVGVIALFVLTAKDTQKAKDEVFDELKEREEPLTNSEKKDVAIKLVKIYSRSLICIVFTITSIVFSTCTFNKRLKDQAMYINSLAAYAAASHAKLREYEDTYGIEKKYTPLPPEETRPVRKNDCEEDGLVCNLFGYNKYFRVPSYDDIELALRAASFDLTQGNDVSLGKLFSDMHAYIYDDNDNKIDLGTAIELNLGWWPQLLEDRQGREWFEFDEDVYTETDDSGFEVTFIDIPVPGLIA